MAGSNGRAHIAPDELTYSPGASSRLALDMVRARRDRPAEGHPTGIAELDAVLNPLRPEELITVLGYTGNGKSMLMNYIARNIAARIHPDERRVVVKITWEQSVEYDTLGLLAASSGLSMTRLARGLVGDDEWIALERAAVKRAVTPIWLVGHSAIESRDLRRRRPRMTMSDVARALEYIADKAADGGLKIDLVVLDYLQRIRLEDSDTRMGYMRAVDRAKDCALAFGCPVLLGSQVSRDVSRRDWALPGLSDALETSNIEQSSQVVLSVWMPKNNRKMYSDMDGPIGPLHVTPNLLILGLLKQTLGEAPRTFAFHADPEHNEIGSLAREVAL